MMAIRGDTELAGEWNFRDSTTKMSPFSFTILGFPTLS
jgi:hypothetical protein